MTVINVLEELFSFLRFKTETKTILSCLVLASHGLACGSLVSLRMPELACHVGEDGLRVITFANRNHLIVKLLLCEWIECFESFSLLASCDRFGTLLEKMHRLAFHIYKHVSM